MTIERDFNGDSDQSGSIIDTYRIVATEMSLAGPEIWLFFALSQATSLRSSLKTPFWIVRNGFISKEESLQVAREYLGKKFNGTNIHKVFSRKKKHVLKYWMSGPTE